MTERAGTLGLLMTLLLVCSGCPSGTQGSGEASAPADEFEEQTLEEPELQLESPPPSPATAGHSRPAFRRLSEELTAPVRIVEVAPTYPERGRPCRGSSRVWVGEIDIDEAGDVAEVRTIQPMRCDPPWPEWEEAIPAAIRQWKYEPANREGRPVPVTITVRISVGEEGADR